MIRPLPPIGTWVAWQIAMWLLACALFLAAVYVAAV